jgi:hypothetical protein
MSRIFPNLLWLHVDCGCVILALGFDLYLPQDSLLVSISRVFMLQQNKTYFFEWRSFLLAAAAQCSSLLVPRLGQHISEVT